MSDMLLLKNVAKTRVTPTHYLTTYFHLCILLLFKGVFSKTKAVYQEKGNNKFIMPSPQKRKRKHLANRKFPRKQTPWNSHRATPDGVVHRPDGTTHITNLHRTLKKKKK